MNGYPSCPFVINELLLRLNLKLRDSLYFVIVCRSRYLLKFDLRDMYTDGGYIGIGRAKAYTPNRHLN